MRISKDIKDRLVNAVITAFIFAASLTWKDTLVEVMDQLLPGNVNSIWSELIVATLITVVVIILVYIIIKSDKAAENRLSIFKEMEENTKSDTAKTNQS